MSKRRKDYVGKEACVLYVNGDADLVYNGKIVELTDTHVFLEQKLGAAPKVISLDRVKKITT